MHEQSADVAAIIRDHQEGVRRRAEQRVRNLVLLHTAKDLDTSNRPLRDRLAAQHYQFSSTVSPLAIAAAQG